MTVLTPPRAVAIDSLLPVVGSDQVVPLVQGGHARYVNLDYAASAPALQPVADHVAQVLPFYSSVHRGAGYHSQVSTGLYENARRDVAGFVGAGAEDVVVFTRNTTDALNLLASAVPGDVVVLDLEHHANLLPWQQRNARVVSTRDTLRETLAAVDAELAAAPAALLAVTGASNVTGEVLPLERLARLAHRHGARIAVDGAQLVPHRRVDLTAAGIDYLAFSGHKLYAPYGVGTLVGRRDWLDLAAPYLAGGGAVREVRVTDTDWAPAPARHEGGTPNVVGVAALAAACRTLARQDFGEVVAHESALRERLETGLERLGIAPVRIWRDGADVVGLLTFVVDGWTARQVATYLSAEHGIGVRDGRFCAHPLMARLDHQDGAVRVSLGLGSRSDDIDRLLAALRQLITTGRDWSYAGPDGGSVPHPDPRPLPDWLPATAIDTDGGASPCAPIVGAAPNTRQESPSIRQERRR